MRGKGEIGCVLCPLLAFFDYGARVLKERGVTECFMAKKEIAYFGTVRDLIGNSYNIGVQYIFECRWCVLVKNEVNFLRNNQKCGQICCLSTYIIEFTF